MKVYLWIFLAFLLIILCIVIYFLVKKSQRTKMRNDILRLFTIACKNKNVENYTLQLVKKANYDVYFESEHSIYYVKIIFNPGCYEICINNAIKWQIRKINDHSERMNFVENIEPLMRLDLRNKDKEEYKLFIVYPNARALLKVINECEMVFVYPDTDVYGASVVSYKNLEEHVDVLDV